MKEDLLGLFVEDIGKWHEARNLIEGSTDQAQYVKLIEEAGELAASIARKKCVKDDIGDMIVVLKNIAMRNNITLTECALVAYKDIAPRKGRMIDGVFVKEQDLPS